MLYDSPLEAQLFCLFDSNKRLIKTGDYYPAAAKLAAGSYEARPPPAGAACRTSR